MKISAFIILGLATFGCVSVNLGQHEAKRARDVHFTPPSSPLEVQSRDDVDAAWKNKSNGNLMSYISDCQDESDPSLDSIVQGALGGLVELKIEATQTPQIQGREARRVIAGGKVDGVPTKIDLLAFKRNRCIYILTYVGVKNSFDADHSQFEKFIDGFRAP